jgi:hypothetical protein
MPLPPGTSSPMDATPHFSQHTYLVSTRAASGTGWDVRGPFAGIRIPSNGMLTVMRGAISISVDDRVKFPLSAPVTIGSIVTDQTNGVVYEVVYARRFETHIDASCSRVAADVNPAL